MSFGLVADVKKCMCVPVNLKSNFFLTGIAVDHKGDTDEGSLT